MIRGLGRFALAVMLVASGAVLGQFAPFGKGANTPPSPVFDAELGKALFEAHAIEIQETDCNLSAGQPDTIGDFLMGYLQTLQVQGPTTHECGGRGHRLCSLSYAVPMGEKTDTKILLFERSATGAIVADMVSCLAQ